MFGRFEQGFSVPRDGGHVLTEFGRVVGPAGGRAGVPTCTRLHTQGLAAVRILGRVNILADIGHPCGVSGWLLLHPVCSFLFF